MITLQGVRGARLGVYPAPLDAPPPINRSVLELPEIVIERYGTEVEYQQATRPAFDALWNTAGFLPFSLLRRVRPVDWPRRLSGARFAFSLWSGSHFNPAADGSASMPILKIAQPTPGAPQNPPADR